MHNSISNFENQTLRQCMLPALSLGGCGPHRLTLRGGDTRPKVALSRKGQTELLKINDVCVEVRGFEKVVLSKIFFF